MKSRSKYHHGELRTELLNLAVERLAAVGVEKLSIRALARQAGVSPTAPFRHFPDKQTLLASLAILGFNELAERLMATVGADSPVEERFVDLGAAYFNFARDFPVHYQLMFGAVLGDFSQSQALQEAAANAYDILDAMLVEIKDNRQLDHDVYVLGGLVWATVHGMASLALNVQTAQRGSDAAPRQAVATLAADIQGPLRMLYAGITDRHSGAR